MSFKLSVSNLKKSFASFLRRGGQGTNKTANQEAVLTNEGPLYLVWTWVLPLLCGLTLGWFVAVCLGVWMGSSTVTLAVALDSATVKEQAQKDGVGSFIAANPFRGSPMATPEVETRDRAVVVTGSLAKATLRGTLPGVGAWLENRGKEVLILVGASFDVYTLEKVTGYQAVFVNSGDRVVKDLLYAGLGAAFAAEADFSEENMPVGDVVPANPGGQSGQVPSGLVDQLVENVKASKFKGILGINIGKNAATPVEKAVDDYLICLEKVYNYASYITVNISSPNTQNLRSLQSGDALTELLETLKKRQLELAEENQHYVPLVLKVAPDLESEDIQFIAQQLLTFKLDGLIVTNTTLSREGVENLPHGDEAGGLSGAPVFAKSTACLAAFAEALKGQIPLIGVGGILSGQDALAKKNAGASLVQVYSGLIYTGPNLIKDCVDAL